MGRQNEVSLPYFELDCHMDDKIELIEAEYGLKGFAIVIKLYQRIYGGEYGYYCEFTPDIALLLAARLCGSSGGVSGKVGTASGEGSLPGFPKNLITDVAAASIRRGIFSERLFKEYGILTSSGIQKQYLKATVKRQAVNLKKEYLLISVPKNRSNVVINSISGVRKTIDGGINSQSNSKSNSKSIVTNNARANISIERFEFFWCCYPLDKNRYLAEQAYINVVSDGIYTEDDLIESAKNYAECCKITDTDKIYHADNFLKKCVFEDYLPGKYRKLTRQKMKNGFNDFERQDYDIEQLEKDLLSN